LADTLKARYDDIEVELIDSGGGAFEVTLDGELIYSKHATGRHPTHEEIFAAID
jgi:selenoprotein W-related protein